MVVEEPWMSREERENHTRHSPPSRRLTTSMSIWTTPVERRLGRRLRWIVAGVAAAFSLLVSFASAVFLKIKIKTSNNVQ